MTRIELKDVTIQFGEKPALLRGVNLSIDANDFVTITGPSGSGKSTLLRSIIGLLQLKSGSVCIDGRSLDAYDMPTIRARIHYMQQVPIALPGTVEDNFLHAFRFRTQFDKAPPSTATMRSLLDELHLTEIALDAETSQLSEGEKKRVSLIRALLTLPDIILCDEPTAGLDVAAADAVAAMLESRHKHSGTGVIAVTHHALKLSAVASRQIRVEGGRLHEVDQ